MTLRAVDLSLGFDGESVLEDLSLTVESGEVVAIIGPSGVGKTTLLRLLALSRRPDSGTVELDGVDAWAVGEEERLKLRRRIGMVFQEPSLFDGSVARNVEYGLRVRRDWSTRLKESVRDLVRSNGYPPAVQESLEMVDMDGKALQSSSDLSGGEAQRVSFARALAYDPDVLLLDEPTSDLDPRNTGVIEEAVQAASERDIGVLMATHDMHQAQRVADRTAVLLGNSLTEVGPTEKVFESPDDDRTRQFVSGELVY